MKRVWIFSYSIPSSTALPHTHFGEGIILSPKLELLKCDIFGLTNGRKSIGRDIAQAEPAAICTVEIGTAMPGGVDLARAATRGDDARGWGAGRLGAWHSGLRTGRIGAKSLSENEVFASEDLMTHQEQD